MKTTLLALMILSLVSRSALSQDIAVLAKSEGIVTKLKKLQPAPYDGILTDETAFRFYVNNADTNFLLTGELEACHQSVQDARSDLISTTTIVSFLLGALSMYYIRR